MPRKLVKSKMTWRGFCTSPTETVQGLKRHMNGFRVLQMECPICGALISQANLDRHVNDHLDQDEVKRDEDLAKQVALAPASPELPAMVEYVSCTQGCGQTILLTEWESHCVVHELEGGKHVSTDEGTSKLLSNGEMRALTISQKREEFTRVEEGLINLLRKCLLTENQRTSNAITGYIEHFQSTKKDFGWGCGWRNIQMLSSHLLGSNEHSEPWKNALYGGVGYVPDIEALQKWLEIAWGKGYDPDGAEHFNREIYGSDKWIGTTECAALLRSFGVRARIVDFKLLNSTNSSLRPTKKPKQHEPFNKEKAVHSNVQCDECGAFPVRGVRYKSIQRANYDLCSKCVKKDKIEEFERIETTTSEEENSNVNHQRLVDWVWNYYTEERSVTVDDRHPSVVISRRPPLYFQHQGHSRTIVGIQRRQRLQGGPEEVFLLVLDPSQRTQDLVKALRTGVGWQKLVKRGVHTLRKAEYQLCHVEPGIAQGKELEDFKYLTSTQIVTM